ncbi:MAG: hypothetical protein COC22_07280, partial [Flavobacteriaceae bacterium]
MIRKSGLGARSGFAHGHLPALATCPAAGPVRRGGGSRPAANAGRGRGQAVSRPKSPHHGYRWQYVSTDEKEEAGPSASVWSTILALLFWGGIFGWSFLGQNEHASDKPATAAPGERAPVSR